MTDIIFAIYRGPAPIPPDAARGVAGEGGAVSGQWKAGQRVRIAGHSKWKGHAGVISEATDNTSMRQVTFDDGGSVCFWLDELTPAGPASWNPNDRAVVVVDKAPDAQGMVEIRWCQGRNWTVPAQALHQLPAMSAEDVTVLEAADRMVTRDGKMVCIPKSPGRATFHENDLADAIVARRAAVRSRAAKQEAEMPQFRVGDQVLAKTPCPFPEYAGQHGDVIPQKSNSTAIWVRFSDGEERGFFADNLDLVEPPDDLHADGDDREAEVVDRADEEGRRVAGLRDAVVEAQMARWDSMGRPSTAAGTSDAYVYQACKALYDATRPAAPVDPVEAENLRLRKALATIRDINLGPDQASASWRVQEAASIAAAALARAP